MTGRTDFITQAVWADIILIWYCLVDDAYKQLERRFGPWRQRGLAPVFTDSEVIRWPWSSIPFFGGHEARDSVFCASIKPIVSHLPDEVASTSAGDWDR
jgi:hypothetical protein